MKMICEIHGEYNAEVTEIFGRKLTSNCPKCEALMEEREMEEQNQRRAIAQREDLLVRGIEPEFFGATLGNYKAETDTERQALEAAQELADGKIRKLLLLGNNGVGKTHLADALAIQLQGVRITMFELSAKIRAGYSNGQSELEILDGLLNHSFIAIDEIGRTKGSDSEKNWMSYLLDKAHTRGIRLMLISNRRTAKHLPPERKGEAIEFFFDNDVISRLRQDSKIVEVIGRDRRAEMGPAISARPAV